MATLNKIGWKNNQQPAINATNLEALEDNVQTFGNTIIEQCSLPIGGGCDYFGTTLPSENYMWADGSAISRTTYATLFAIIGTTYGIGDGSTTFNLPDKRARVSVMVKSEDDTFSTIGTTGGEKKHTLSNSELPAHGHQVRLWNKIGSTTPVRTFDSNGNQTTSSLGLQTANVTVSGVNSSTWVGSGIVAAQNGQGDQAGSADKAGGGQAHNILQPFIVCNYIIRVK